MDDGPLQRCPYMALLLVFVQYNSDVGSNFQVGGGRVGKQQTTLHVYVYVVMSGGGGRFLHHCNKY